MSFKKPFRATPVRLGEYQRHQAKVGRKRHAAKQASYAARVVGSCIAVSTVTWVATPSLINFWTAFNRSPEEVSRVEQSVYYINCDDARAAGAAPIYAGSPGYREGMDGDSDGIACEPYR